MLKLLPLVLFFGCVTSLSVRQPDLDAWVGAPLIELQQHPKLSRFAVEVRTYSDGRQLHIYSNGVKDTDKMKCKLDGDEANCELKAGKARGCANEFWVSPDNRIERVSLRPIGIARCVTDCSFRPNSNPCSSDAH